MNPDQLPSLPTAETWAAGDTPENGSREEEIRTDELLAWLGLGLIAGGVAAAGLIALGLMGAL